MPAPMMMPTPPAVISTRPRTRRRPTGGTGRSAQGGQIGGERPDVLVAELERRHVRARALLRRIPQPAHQVLLGVSRADVRELGPDRRPGLADDVAAGAAVDVERGLAPDRQGLALALCDAGAHEQ